MTDPTETHNSTPIARLRPHLPKLVLLLSLTIVSILRYMAVRQHMDMGQDMANYLITMNTFFGHDVTGSGLLRPPLIALPLKACTLVFGDLNGAKLLGVFISVAIGLPFYLIAKRVSSPWIATAMSILFVLTPAYANMLSWGYITMFGIFFTLLAVYFFMLTFESGSRRNAFFAGLFASLVFGFHQLTAAFFVPLCGMLLAALIIFNRHRNGRYWANAALGVSIGVILSLPFVPVYIHLLQMQSSEGGTTALSASLLGEFTSRLWYLPWTWAAVLGILGTLASLVSLWRRDRNPAILLATLFLFPLLLLLFTLPPPFVELNRRAHYFLYVPIWAISGYILSVAWPWRPSVLPPPFRSAPRLAVACLSVALVVYGAVFFQQELSKGLDFYTYLDETRWNAVQWTRLHTPEDAIVAAYPENLGWWIEGAAPRTVLEVTARNMEANRVERQRALIAELLMSRNQGMENGYIRIATCYPYTNAPGNPVIGAYVVGKYQDLLMFDDGQSSVQIEGSGTFDMDDATSKEFSLQGNSASMQMTTSYHIGDATITQTVTLEQGRQKAVVTYAIQSNGQAVTRLHIPSYFCYQPESVLVNSGDSHIEVVQELKTPFQGIVPVTTRLTVDTTGATFATPDIQEDSIPLSFDIQKANASVELAFDISTTQQPNGEQVVAYQVAQLIKDNAIDYLAIDLRPHSASWSDAPLGLEEWLNACPYYKLVYPPEGEGDIRIYEVDASALP